MSDTPITNRFVRRLAWAVLVYNCILSAGASIEGEGRYATFYAVLAFLGWLGTNNGGQNAKSSDG